MACVSPEESAEGAFPDREEECRRSPTPPPSDQDPLIASEDAAPDEIWFTGKDGRVTLLGTDSQGESGVVNGFHLALHNTPVSVAILDRDLRYVWAYNQQGGRPDEIIGMKDEEVFSRGEAAKLDALKRRVLDEGVEVRHQTWLDRPEGRTFLDVTYQPIIDQSGEVSGIGMTAVDLTQMKLVEEELRRSREDMARAQSVGQIGSWRLDTREDVLTWSDEVYRIFGVPRGTPLTYRTFLDRVHPDDRDFVDERWQAALRSEPYDIEHRLLVDGQVKWVREKAFLEYDDAGEPLGGFGITQDVTQRKRAEEALREREAEKASREERSRLARDLHDSVTQALFAVTMKTEAMAFDEELPPHLKRAVHDIERLSRGALAQMRTLLLELRNDPIEAVSIRQLLRHLVEATAGRTSTQIQLDVTGDDLLPPALHVAVYRITQEALNNVARHARADHASVVLESRSGRIHLSIEDDGSGFDVVPDCPGHLGIAGMRERAEEAGARLRIVSRPGKGTLVLLSAEPERT